MIKIAIVEDDEKSSQSLVSLIHKIQSEFSETIEIDTYPNGLDFIDGYQPIYDIVFMDIDMPLMNGMEASKILREKDVDVDLVFTTALSQYAIYGYDVSATAFLVKPFDNDEKSIEKIRHVIQRKINTEKNYFVFAKENSFTKISVNEITYVESFNHYCVFHTRGNDSFRRLCSMKSVDEQLSKQGFLRSDNSYLINPLYALKWDKDSVDINGVNIPVSRSRRKEFFEKLAISIGEKYQ